MHRALRGLPVELLEPLLDGLRRYTGSLTPGSLETGDGEGCAIGMMLREIADDPRLRERGAFPPAAHRSRFHRPGPSVYHRWPALAKAHPRLLHLETFYDGTCAELVARGELPEEEVPQIVGLWMAAETESEINMRHLEAAPAGAGLRAGAGRAGRDERLFQETVDRLVELRPWLSRPEAIAAVEALSRGRSPGPGSAP